ncbi:MAG: FecR domain-containing protein [Labilithrix sp.]|nr:FecR domain-containing protein [Labilithrix sp.]MCW5816638.1 FecR domain-containing protein [Labilithrix sp.]
MSAAVCGRARADIVGILEGDEALRDHVAQCDDCRDAVHTIEQVTAKVAPAGDDFVVSDVLADRLAEIAAEAERVSVTRVRTEVPVTPKSAPAASAKSRPSRRSIWLLVAACLSVSASAVIGFSLADRQRSPAMAATRAWHGKVAKIARAGADAAAEPGIFVVDGKDKRPLLEGAEVKAGMHVATDGKTRARIWLEDGTTVVLDRATDVTVGSEPRTLTLHDGALLADVAHIAGAAPARVQTPNGEVRVLGTKLSLTATPERTNVEVLRGEVEVAAGGEAKRVAAGQEGVVGKDGKVDVAPANDLAQRAAFGEQLIATHNEDTEAPASGLGELRAKQPGKNDEKDHAVRLARHAVKVRIAGNVARTEIDETFANDTDAVLEGIYRFPLPPGALIERLALEVDGKLIDGEFVDKAKSAAIWRGAIQNAAPKAPKPKEQIIWVPGPWHDPALLEWQRGGRFELRIFPIPKKGARRVVIAYTETIEPVSGVRRYVYPLPQGASSKITIDDFSVDAQVVGHDAATPVRARGYELEKKSEGGIDRLATSMQGFVPSGDLAIEYAMNDKATDVTAWGYRADAPPPDPKKPDPIGSDPFVAIALRPKLPKWSESKPRDQVIVVDAGRTMYGERFARAKRLAVQMTQEMDRRDRVTVIACDVGCRALPGGFVAPGAPSAHDVDAFLTSVTPDGASDLVGAVRAAAKLGGRDSARDLRVALLSDGVATAGYRSPARVASEVGDALGDPRALVVTVPIGADADTGLLGDLARGGGGVVVPYQPGQRLEASALEVLNATYGTTLRDVEVVLPDGLREMAPATVAPMRAGSETIVTARMSGDAVKGDIVLRGKVGGDPFEAKYPIEVRASDDAGNAFVPRLFAAARIADRERTPGANQAEIVALSHRFAVPARQTSLIVLESDKMFEAFGIDRTEHGPRWTGETVAQGTTVAAIPRAIAGGDDSDGLASAFSDEDGEEKSKADKGLGLGSLGAGSGGGGFGRAEAAPPAPAPAAAPTLSQEQKAGPAKRRPAADLVDPFSDATASRRWRGDRGGQFMKKVFVRRATLTADATPAVSAEKVAAARAAVAAAPDERSKHKDLAKLLALSGQLDELEETLAKWSERDPLDFDVIVGRAEIAARRGNRDTALRIMGGALAANALSNADAYTMAQTVARSFERMGRPEGCAFHIAAAEMKPADPEALGWAISCERAEGRSASAERWLVGLKDAQRTAVTNMLATLEQKRTESARGDIVVNATWSGGVDLDLAIVDPSGRRCAAVTRLKGARVEGATARDRETLAMTSSDGGSFAVEVVRANAAETTPVSGNVTIKAFGQTRTVPFTLTGARAQVGRVDVRWEQELVPVTNPDEIANANVQVGGAQFDRAAANASLSAVSLRHCSASGQVGTGHATITFSPTGGVSQVVVDDPTFSGTPAGRCVQTSFFNARVPAFTGAPVRVGKSFSLQ